MAISKERGGILYIIQNDKGTIVMGLPQSLRSFAMTQYLALLFLDSLVKGDSAIGGGGFVLCLRNDIIPCIALSWLPC